MKTDKRISRCAEGRHHSDSREDQDRERRQLVPSTPNLHKPGASKISPMGAWGKDGARLGRGGTAVGQEAQHHKMDGSA